LYVIYHLDGVNILKVWRWCHWWNVLFKVV